MHRKIYKYPVHPENPGGITVLELPHGAIPLCVHEQRGEIMVWFEISTRRAPNWRVEIVCRGTGQEWEAAERGEFIGTAFWNELVYHLYLRDA